MAIMTKGIRALNKLFNVRPHEWRRLLLLYGMILIFNCGVVWGDAIIIGSFLQQIGVDYLPFVIAVISVISIPAMAIYTAFADRVSNDKLMIGILLSGVLGLVGGLVLLSLGLPNFAYPIFYLITYVPLGDIFRLHRATYTNSFYDTRTAKRIIPILATAGRVAGIVAGLTMPLLNTIFLPEHIITIYISALILSASITWLTPRILKEPPDAGVSLGLQLTSAAKARADKPWAAYFDHLREGYTYVLQSPFLRWLALSTLVMTLLLTLLNFQALEILQNLLVTTESISSYTGQLTGIASLILLPLQLFLLGRIIGRIGLGNANLIYPVGSLAVSGGLIFSGGQISAGLAYLNDGPIRLAFQNPADTLLYNAVPLRVKGRARAFIGGFVTPVGSLIGSGLILLFLFASVRWLLPISLAVLAITYAALGLVIRKQYGQALITMLEQEDYSFLLSQEASDLTVADPATLRLLEQKLQESTDPRLAVFIAKLISQIGGRSAVSILGKAAKRTQDGQTRAGLIDALVAADIQGDEIQQLYLHFINDPNKQVRLSAIAGLEELVGPNDEQFLSPILKMLEDPEVEIRTRILLSLAQSADFYALAPAVETMNQLLAQTDPSERGQGVMVLGRVVEVLTGRRLSGVTRPVYHLTTFLTDPDDQVRLHAAQAIETVSKNKMTAQLAEIIVQQMSSHVDDPVERIRQATLVVYGRLGTEESHPILIKALSDISPQVRATAIDTFVEVGDEAIIPIVQPLLNSPDRQLRLMAAVILSRISPKGFNSLVESHITNNLLTVYRNIGRIEALSSCVRYPTIPVLQSALREQNQTLLDEIFYLLSVIYDPEDVEIVTDSLKSDNARVQANAIEALEALTSPQTARLIAPLFERDVPPAKLFDLALDIWRLKSPDLKKALKELVADSENAWFRAITTVALGEIGVSLKSNGAEAMPANGQEESQSKSAALDGLDLPVPGRVRNRKEKRKRRPVPADLLGLLSDTTQDESAQPTADEEINSQTANANQIPFTRTEIEALLDRVSSDLIVDVRQAAEVAQRIMAGFQITEIAKEEVILLSTIEKIIFLKQVPFFQGMTINQLEVLANICEEELFVEDQWIFNQGDPGGALYVIVSGQVGIEQEQKRHGSYARLATLGAHTYFGEMTLFDGTSRTAAAIALQDTLMLRIRREPLIALARQYPDVSLELIHILSERLRLANSRIAELTRSRPRELQKLFDKLD